MTAQPNLDRQSETQLQDKAHRPASETQAAPILCQHCLRTATNEIKCKGLCVADSDY